jgi:hypothetical protein
MVGEDSLKQLEAVETDPQLHELEKALKKFNIFEAVVGTHRELSDERWHSSFLADLLNPGRNHGLGDIFLRRFCEAMTGLPRFDSLDRAVVHREYRISPGPEAVHREYGYIDILVVDEPNTAVILIENKIWAYEGAEQLKDYWDAIRREYPQWNQRGVYLTPDGRKPAASSDLEGWTALSYKQVVLMLEELLNDRRGQWAKGVEPAIEHYVAVLRRYIVGDIEAEEALARRLYFKHRAAWDLMNPNTWKQMIKTYLLSLIKEQEQLKPGQTDVGHVRFRPKSWDRDAGLTFWQLYFEFSNQDAALYLGLWLGAAKDFQSGVRDRVLELVKNNGRVFGERPPPGKGYFLCYYKPFLTQENYAESADEQLRTAISSKWDQFVEHDLPAITQAFEREDWFRRETERPAEASTNAEPLAQTP